MTRRTVVLIGAMVAGIAATAAAMQQPAAAPPASASPAATAPAGNEAQAPSPTEQPQGFTYNPEGRRDPFVSLLLRGAEVMGSGGTRPPGLGGLLVSEVSLRGVVQGQSGPVGMLLGVDQRTYIVRPGDRLLDGTIQTISPTALVILQEVNDPLSVEKQREVRKFLRQSDEAQQ